MNKRSWIVVVLFGLMVAVWCGVTNDQTTDVFGGSPPNEEVTAVVPSPHRLGQTDQDKPGATQPASIRSRSIKPLPRSQWQPLPADRLPVKSIYAILKARADQGDAPAACRLAAELGRCLMLEDTLESIQQGDPQIEADLAGPHGKQAKLRHKLALNCAGLGSGELNERMGLLRQAALAGNVSAIEEYVSGLWVSQDIYSASYHLDDYRKDAPRLAEAALASGSLWVLMEMKGVYKGQIDNALISMAMGRPHQPERAVVLDMLWKLAYQQAKLPEQPFDARLSGLRAEFQGSIPESEYPRLEAQALDHYRNWFQGQPQSIREMGLSGENSDEEGRGFNELCSKGYATAEALENPIDWQD